MVQKWDNMTYETILGLMKKESHLRELSNSLKIPHTTLSRNLKSLRDKNIVDYRLEGKNKVFFIKKNLISQKIAINAENYKFLKVTSKHPELIVIFEEIIKKSNCSLIILFGSYAKDTEKKESDIDVYLDTLDAGIKKNIERIYDNLSIKIGEFSEEDFLIQEIIKNHVIIKGAEVYYDKTRFLR